MTETNIVDREYKKVITNMFSVNHEHILYMEIFQVDGKFRIPNPSILLSFFIHNLLLVTKLCSTKIW